MSQTKKQTLVEVFTGTGVGILGSLLITWAVLFTVPDRMLAGVINVAACAIWSLVRGYYVRRYFNKVQA